MLTIKEGELESPIYETHVGDPGYPSNKLCYNRLFGTRPHSSISLMKGRHAAAHPPAHLTQELQQAVCQGPKQGMGEIVLSNFQPT